MAGTGEGNQLRVNKNKNKINNNNNNKVERKVTEKNRRNQMKLLYSKLNSLLPTHHSNDDQVPLTVSNQIEEAIQYIKSLETKLKNEKEKKHRFLESSKTSTSSSPTRRQRSSSTVNNNNYNPPQLKIKDMGSAMDVVLTTGLEDPFMFYDIIHIFHEERVEIINASYSVIGNTVFYSLHAQIEDVVYEFGATKLTERLKGLVYKWKSDAKILQAAAVHDDHPAANTPTTSSDRR